MSEDDVRPAWYSLGMNQWNLSERTTSSAIIEDLSKLILVGTLAYIAIKREEKQHN